MRHQREGISTGAFILVGALQFAASGCGRAACSADYRYGLVVTVIRPSTATRICDATVTATDDGYRETLAVAQTSSDDGGAGCVYQGAGERAGTYTIQVHVDSSDKVVGGIVVTRDECHVIPRAVTIDP